MPCFPTRPWRRTSPLASNRTAPAARARASAARAVASFFGEINLWDGTVTKGGIDCAALGLALPVPCALPIGTSVGVAVRPEQVGFDLDQEIAVGGTVAEVIYRGAMSTIL